MTYLVEVSRVTRATEGAADSSSWLFVAASSSFSPGSMAATHTSSCCYFSSMVAAETNLSLH